MLRNKYKYREQINMADCGVAALAWNGYNDTKDQK